MKIVLSYMIESQSYHRFSSMTEKQFFSQLKIFKYQCRESIIDLHRIQYIIIEYHR